jgi:hypothetical protein
MQAMPSPNGNAVPGGTDRISSAGTSPRLQTDAATASALPAPCTNSHATTLIPMIAIVTYAGRRVTFSSW